MKVFENISNFIDSATDQVHNIIECTTDNVQNFVESAAGFTAEMDNKFKEGINNVKVFSKDVSENIQISIEDKANEINPYLGQAVSKFNEGIDVIEDVGETFGNTYGAISKKVPINAITPVAATITAVMVPAIAPGAIVASATPFLASAVTSHFGNKELPELNLGDHINIDCIVYTHHGVFVGNNQVVHYAHRDTKNPFVHKCTLEKFAENKKIQVFNKAESPIRYEPEEVIRRANSRIGENSYNLLFNNCENFARWCRFGK